MIRLLKIEGSVKLPYNTYNKIIKQMCDKNIYLYKLIVFEIMFFNNTGKTFCKRSITALSRHVILRWFM